MSVKNRREPPAYYATLTTKLAEASCPYLVGVDEVGRGSLAGPVAVGIVLVRKGWKHPAARDSKVFCSKLSRKQAWEAIQPEVLWSGVFWCDSQGIDALGMGEALNRLFVQAVGHCLWHLGLAMPVPVVIDGDPIAEPHKTDVESFSSEVYFMPKADYWIPAVSAASMVAKVARDAWMVEVARHYPGYDFEHNVGYGAPKHLVGLERLGLCPLHRKTFVPKHFQYAHAFPLELV